MLIVKLLFGMLALAAMGWLLAAPGFGPAIVFSVSFAALAAVMVAPTKTPQMQL